VARKIDIWRNRAVRNTIAKSRFICGWIRNLPGSGSEGQSLVEFALVFPMMIMTLMFMFSLALAMVNFEQLSVAVSGAAQQDLANATVITSGDPCAAIQSAITSSLPSFTASKLTYTVNILNSSGATVTYGPTTGSGFTCTAAVTILNADEAAGQQSSYGTLTVSYAYSWLPVYRLVMSGNLGASQTVLIYL